MPTRLVRSSALLRPAVRGIGLTITTVLIGAAALLIRGSSGSAREHPPLERGNKPGEWRYWGADAWSTRYTPLDQIDASNFDSLRVAWVWNAGQ